MNHTFPAPVLCTGSVLVNAPAWKVSSTSCRLEVSFFCHDTGVRTGIAITSCQASSLICFLCLFFRIQNATIVEASELRLCCQRISLLADVPFLNANFLTLQVYVDMWSCVYRLAGSQYPLPSCCLQDEGLRQRKALRPDNMVSNSGAMMSKQQSSSSLPSLLVVIAAIFIGFFLGKFIL